MTKNLHFCRLLPFIIIFLAFNQQLLAQPPVINSFSPSKGPVGTLVTVTGTNLGGTPGLKIGGVNAIAVSNTGTKMVAMVMPGAVTGLVSVIANGDTAYGQGNFTITATLMPNKQQGGKLVGSGGSSYAAQGFSVAISADGNTAVVGGNYDNGNAGAVWVFVRDSSNVWAQQGSKLVGNGAVNGPSGANQGQAVAISADGNTIIESGDNDSLGLGATWVFTRNNSGVWQQQGNKLVGTGAVGFAQEGYVVALSADGSTAVIGSCNDSSYAGAFWVFARTNSGEWVQQGGKLAGAGAVGAAEQGYALGVSADGGTIVSGGYNDNNQQGAIWVFKRNNSGQWLQQGDKLVGTGAATGGAGQGSSIALSADGNIFIEGGWYDNSGEGAVWMFARDSSGAWAQQGNKLVGTGDDPYTHHGIAVGLSADGSTAVEAGEGYNNQTGAFWVFTRAGNGTWAQNGSKLTGTGAATNAGQGWSIALSANGGTAILGGPFDNGVPFGGNTAGASWVFNDSTASVLPVTLLNFTAYQYGKGVQTTWDCYNEINMTGYDVERSNDGYTFNTVGNVPAKVNLAAENLYGWFDAAPFLGDNFYRIKQIGKNGWVQYGNIVKVTIGGNNSSIQLYPNPINNKMALLHLKNVGAGAYTICVYNAAGQKVYAASYTHNGGDGVVSIPLSAAPSGVYVIEVKGGKNALQTKAVLP